MSIPARWRSVTRGSPCPICGKPDWCRVNAVGTLAACRRVAEGAYRTGADRAGVTYHLHRLDGTARATIDPPSRPSANGKPDRTDPDTLHRVYQAMLAQLPLSGAHRDNLLSRGLPAEDIDRRGYATLPGPGRAKIARELRERFGDTVLSVPGFAVREQAGRRYVTIAGPAGLLVPCRDVAGRIVALKVRRDAGAGAKYVFLSSAYHGGPGPDARAHCPLGVTVPADTVRVTEGELKSDIALSLTGTPTISIPGVAGWRTALPVLRELGARTVRLALDADAASNPHVGRALSELAEALGREGLAVELERWPAPHKGIDDALAAGVAIELLTGDAAREVIAAIAAAAKPATPLDRLDAALAEGAEALFRDRDLLAALARLAESDPAEFACARAKIQRGRVSLRSLDNALAPRRREVRRAQPPPDSAEAYRIVGGRIVREVLTRDGPVELPLATWAARIIEEAVYDDGAEQRITLAVEGSLADGTPLLKAEVPADRFAWMRWPVELWGTRAVVLAGAGTADHLRAALQLLSGDVPRRTVYGHTGWREIGGAWHYLHGGGAIGADGSTADIEVSLPDALGRYQLPPPPSGAALTAAVRASLGLLDGLAPDSVAVPLLAAVARAPLGAADFGLHIVGQTGTQKTELAALAQQHWGAGLDARHLPGSWTSTGNALEGLLFGAKDALTVIDDFAPHGNASDVQRYHRDGDRVFRGQGNQSGRARCRVDGTVRAARPPRGLPLSTGEDAPRGQSLRARLLIVELGPGDVDLGQLTVCQGDAAAGRYAEGLAGFIRWLAPRIGDLQAGGLAHRRAELRDRAIGEAPGGHARTPGIVADLYLGLSHYLDYAVEVGALDATARDALTARCWAALLAAGRDQSEHAEAAEPCGQFVSLLAGALSSGRCHLAGPDGDRPDNPSAWGWREITIGTGQFQRDEWQPQGHRIGWLDGADLYLQPQAAFAEAQRLAGEQGQCLPIAEGTLWRRMNERGLLAATETRGGRNRLTVRRTLDSMRRAVLQISPDALCPPSESGPCGPIDAARAQNGPLSWATNGNGPQEWPTKVAHETSDTGPIGPQGPPAHGGNGRQPKKCGGTI